MATMRHTIEKIVRAEFTGDSISDIMNEVAEYVRIMEKTGKYMLADIKPVLDDEGWVVSLFVSEV